MHGYYAERLSADRLRRCYEIASPRVQRYLESEIRHVLDRLARHTGEPARLVLELGCGYGRVARRLAGKGRRVVGIDTAIASLETAGREPGPTDCQFACMDAVAIGFADDLFDAVVCVQNGICAFGADPETLMKEALRVTRTGGMVLLSSYSDRFWPHRLAWFEAQAAAGLIGPVDRTASRDGVIVCDDGFRAGRLSPDDMRALCRRLGVEGAIEEVDGSSVFCEIVKPRSL